MKGCIITIGDEILQGYTVDTNSAWLGKTLLDLDIQISEIITIPDDLEYIIKTTKNALSKNFEYIFITGGLGPTHDDITKKAMKFVFQSEEYFDKEYYNLMKEKFASLGIQMAENNKSQAMILSKSTTLPNSEGTALGMRFKFKDKQIFVMPGVPREMKKITKSVIIPEYLLENKVKNETITLLTTGVAESSIFEKINDLINEYNGKIKISFLPQYTGVKIRIRSINRKYLKFIPEIIDKITIRLGKNIYGKNKDSLEEVIGNILKQENKTIAVAESCTGGLISKRLTNIPGSSQYYLGSIIAYDNSVKEKLLNISLDTLNEFGAVSEEVVAKMAVNVRKLMKANIGVATSGISGPGVDTDRKSVGLIYIGIADGKNIKVRKFNFPKNREIHRNISSQTALNMLRLHIIE